MEVGKVTKSSSRFQLWSFFTAQTVYLNSWELLEIFFRLHLLLFTEAYQEEHWLFSKADSSTNGKATLLHLSGNSWDTGCEASHPAPPYSQRWQSGAHNREEQCGEEPPTSPSRVSPCPFPSPHAFLPTVLFSPSLLELLCPAAPPLSSFSHLPSTIFLSLFLAYFTSLYIIFFCVRKEKKMAQYTKNCNTWAKTPAGKTSLEQAGKAWLLRCSQH